MGSIFMRYFILLVFVMSSTFSEAQDYFRIKGDFSVKSKNDSIGNLTMGTFYYDKHKRNIVYDIHFPSRQTWVFADTTIYRFEEDSLISKDNLMSINEFSIFHLVLSNHLSDYGLGNSLYSIKNIESEGEMVFTTWEPPVVARKVLGDVIISNKGKRLHGIVFYNAEEKLLRKQIFKTYKNFKGLEFPTEILDVFYTKNDTVYQKTTYSNLVINEVDNNKFYDFKLPEQYSSVLTK